MKKMECFKQNCQYVHLKGSRRRKKGSNILGEIALQNDSKFIALTETWLRPCVEDAEVKIKGFTLLRAYRKCLNNPDFPHGGVCLYLRVSVPEREY